MQTRKTLMISAAAVALAMSAPSAHAASSYVSLFGGGSFLEKPGLSGTSRTHTTTTLDATSTQSVDTSFKTGFVVGGNWGVDWGTFRTELESAYRSSKSSSHARLKQSYNTIYHNYYTSSGAGPYDVPNAFGMNTATDATVPANLKMTAWSLMANAWYDFHDVLPYNITPYVGGGVGGALVKISGHLGGFLVDGTPVNIKLNEKNAFVFAWQVGAGMSVPVTDGMKLFLDYRYFAADGAQLKLSPGFHGGDVTGDFDAHSVLVGLRIDL
jgi:opacity protein-like surface antigen